MISATLGDYPQVPMLHIDPPRTPLMSAIGNISPPKADAKTLTKRYSGLDEVCRLLNIDSSDSVTWDHLQFEHDRFETGECIYAVGQPFDTLHVVNAGFLKIGRIDANGVEQVMGFPMKGDILGVDGINTHHYVSSAVALSNCDLILLPIKVLMDLGHTHSGFENAMYRIISRELLREQTVGGMLGGGSAKTRLAYFFVTLAAKFAALGYSSERFNLRMTRQEIASHLGLNGETITRTLMTLRERGIVAFSQRTIHIKDPEALQALCSRSYRSFEQKKCVAKQSIDYFDTSATLPSSS